MDKKLKNNILKGSAATSIGTVTGMVFQFLTVMIMARYVPKDDFGIYVLVMVIVNMFNLLGGFGLELTMVKFIASVKKEERESVLSPVLVLRAIGSIIFSIVFFFTAGFLLHFFDDRLNNYLWYITIIFILANYRDLFYNLMQGLNYFKQYSYVNVLSSFFRVLLTIVYAIFWQLNIESLLLIEILSTLQPMLHQLIVIPFKNYLTRGNWGTYLKIIRFSVPLYINNLVVFLNGRSNIFIIGAFMNPSSVANYDVANKVPIALKKIFQSFIIVYFPNLAKLFSSGDKKNAMKLIEKSMGIFSLVTSFMVLFTFLFKDYLTELLYSSVYAEISLAFALLIFNFLIRGWGDLMGYTLLSAGHPSVSPRINAIASIISLSLSLLLIPKYGYMGAVYALLCMNIISSQLFFLYLKKYDINPAIKVFLKPALVLLAAPLSFLYNGEFSLVYSTIIFTLCIAISWFMIEDLREAVKFLTNKIIKLKWQKI